MPFPIVERSEEEQNAKEFGVEEKSEKIDVNSQYPDEDLETVEVIDINKTSPDEVANANQALTLINGIFGYVNEIGKDKQPTGNKIWLSLTPYEIAPRLADITLFRPNESDVSGAVDFVSDFPTDNKRAGQIKTNLRKGMTVGNRLQAARIVTNFMTEILNPRLDTRFSSKDHRIGQASRFLNSESGEEQDRSAFLHIVPDLDLSNGRIAIPFGIEGKDVDPNTGTRKIESYRNAFIPVNFNFVHSKYTLTIKEFILNSVSEQNREIYSLDKTFDGNVLRFFGSHPKIISLSGLLSNFDDDLIGLEKLFGEVTGTSTIGETQNVEWSGSMGTGNQTATISSKGSMRDVFLSYYQNFLKGTKARDYGLKIYLYYNWRIIEGFLVDLNVQSSGENDNVMMFSANMVVKSESSVYEQGVGLGKSVPFNFYSRRFGAFNKTSGEKDLFELDKVFTTEEMQYRRAFRDYAIQESLNILKASKVVLKSKDHPNDVYMQLLLPDDPGFIRDAGFDTIKTTETGRKLESNSLSSEVKKLINFNIYKLIISAFRYNKSLDAGKVIRTLTTKAWLQVEPSSSSFPSPGENSLANWLSDTTNNKEGSYFTEIWEVFKQRPIQELAEAFIKGLNVEGRTFKLIGPVAKPNIIASDQAFIDFNHGSTDTGILQYIKSNWIDVSQKAFPGDYSAVAALSLSSAIGYIPAIAALVQ